MYNNARNVRYDYTPEELTALFRESNKLKKPPAATFVMPGKKPPPIGYDEYLKETQENRTAPFLSEAAAVRENARMESDETPVKLPLTGPAPVTPSPDKPWGMSPQLIERLKSGLSQPESEYGKSLPGEYGNAAPVTGVTEAQDTAALEAKETPGFLSRLGRGFVGALKGGVTEGLSAIRLGNEGYKALQLQKELMPLQKELATAKAGAEQTQADKDFANRKLLIEHQQKQEQIYAPSPATPKGTVGDLERSYLDSLSPEERNALLKRRVEPTKSLQEQIDEFSRAGQPIQTKPAPASVTSPAVIPAIPVSPTTSASVPVTAPVNAEKEQVKSELKAAGYTDSQIEEFLSLMK